MSIRYSLKSPIGPCMIKCMQADSSIDSNCKPYAERIWRILRQMDNHHDEISVLLSTIGNPNIHSFTALPIKMYIISWATLTDLIAYLISEVFDLGLPPDRIELGHVLRNRHIASTIIPQMFKQNHTTLRTKEFSKKRNDIVHRSYLDEPVLHALENESLKWVENNLIAKRQPVFGTEEVFARFNIFFHGKQLELTAHYDDTMKFVDQLLEQLALVVEKKLAQKTI